MLIRSSIARRLLVLLLDCVAVAAITALVILGMLFLGAPQAPGLVLDIALSVGAANALWLGMRLLPRVFNVTDKARREELALTLIMPKEYLKPALAAPARWALAPAGLGLPILLIIHLRDGLQFDSRTPALCAAVGLIGYTSLALSRANLWLLTRWLCRPRRRSGFEAPGFVAVGAVVSLTPLAFVIVMDEWLGWGIWGALAIFAVFFPAAYAADRIAWRLALRKYFALE